MLLCSSVWMPPLCLKKSYATPGPFHSFGTVPDPLCKYSTLISSHSRLHCFMDICSGRRKKNLFYIFWSTLADVSVPFVGVSSVLTDSCGYVMQLPCLCLCLLPQHQRRFCGTQPNLSTRHVPAAASSRQGGERGGRGGGRRLPLTLPPLPPPTSPPPSLTHTGNQ